jgi:predicted dehydrogenase
MTATGPVGVGFIGTGMISNTYLENLTTFPDINVVILGDLDTEVAKAQAAKHGIPQWGTAADVLAHPDVELIVNLTIPAVHAQVASEAIAAGKHVWSEKPISVDRESGRALLAQAQAAGLLVGVAPDTVLGPGVQTARRAIAHGDIGEPLSAQTVMQYIGPDIFHPSPEFLFSKGAGWFEEPGDAHHPDRGPGRHGVRRPGPYPRQCDREVRRRRDQSERVQLRLADGEDGCRRDHRDRRHAGDP